MGIVVSTGGASGGGAEWGEGSSGFSCRSSLTRFAHRPNAITKDTGSAYFEKAEANVGDHRLIERARGSFIDFASASVIAALWSTKAPAKLLKVSTTIAAVASASSIPVAASLAAASRAFLRKAYRFHLGRVTSSAAGVSVIVNEGASTGDSAVSKFGAPPSGSGTLNSKGLESPAPPGSGSGEGTGAGRTLSLSPPSLLA